jgi:hypothetical protein
MKTRMALTFTLLAALLAASCADRRASSPAAVLAHEGGTVTTTTHAIEIPPMALEADATVSLRVSPATDYPALANALSQVLLIEPEGVVLARHATVTIHGEFIAAPEGSTVSIAQLASADGVTGWTLVESTRDLETGDVTVPIDRFAPLAVVVSAPAAGAAAIRGSITWGDGTPAAGAPIQLFQVDARLTEQPADATGRFAFGDLEPGAYRLVVEYECTLSQAVEVAAGEMAEVTLTLCGG